MSAERELTIRAETTTETLPEGWALSRLQDLVEFTLGGQWGEEPSAQPVPDTVRVSVIRSTEFKKWAKEKGTTAAIRQVPISSLQKRRLLESDIVVEISGGSPDQPVGRTIVVDETALKNAGNPLICSNFCRQLRVYPSLDSSFVNFSLMHQYNGGRFNIFQTETTNIRNLNFSRLLSETTIPLPPTMEQERISTQIADLLTQVTRARDNLLRISAILKRFRQAVITEACSGRLTVDWREKHLEVEPATLAVEHILQARQNKNQSAVKPVESDELPELPDSWVWARFGTLLGELRNGISTKPELSPPGVSILRINSVRSGSVSLDEHRFLPNGSGLVHEYGLHDGDLLFTRYNGSLDLLGVCGMVRGLGSASMLYPDKLMRVRFDQEDVYPAYAELFFRSNGARERLTGQSRSSAGQQGVSGADIKSQPFALPPFQEQIEITSRVSRLLILADTIENHLAKASICSDKLTQSILTKAFRGELVPTEAELARREGREYEPASVLLERIKKQRESEAQSKPSKTKRSTKASLAAPKG